MTRRTALNPLDTDRHRHYSVTLDSEERRRPACSPHPPDIKTLIAQAPWPEAVTYRDSWPHEYGLVKKGRSAGPTSRVLRTCLVRGEGIEYRFFSQERKYLFLGECKYRSMTDYSDIDL